jgi:hypothetical protein
MKRLLTILGLLGAASVSPLIFPMAEAGHSSMDVLAIGALLPAIAVTIMLIWLLHRFNDFLAKQALVGLGAGAIATIGLEVIRIAGFRLGFMPGNLPRLMGVLLLNQFATGPTLTSDITGWGYHFWNGASFGLIYVLLLGTCRRWVGALFGIFIGIGFMLSPVVSSLGVGFVGLGFSKGFPVTVTLAHLAFGGILGWLTARWLGFLESPLLEALADTVRTCLPRHHPAQSARLRKPL